MDRAIPDLPERRTFLKTAGGALAASLTTPALVAASSTPAFASASAESPQEAPVPASVQRKIPIGVFDPAFPDWSLDEMIEKFAAWGIEAVEIGTGGYPESKHCPVQSLLDDPAKARAWKKKFEDKNIRVATLSCHGNPVHPDAKIAQRDAETFKRTVILAERLEVEVIVGFSGCPGGNATDTMPVSYTHLTLPTIYSV